MRAGQPGDHLKHVAQFVLGKLGLSLFILFLLANDATRRRDHAHASLQVVFAVPLEGDLVICGVKPNSKLNSLYQLSAL